MAVPLRRIAALALLLMLALPTAATATDRRERFSHDYDPCVLNNGRGVAILLGVWGPRGDGAEGADTDFRIGLGTAEFVNLEGVPSRSTFVTAAHNFFLEGKPRVFDRPDFESAYQVLLPQWTKAGCRIRSYRIKPGSLIALSRRPVQEAQRDQALFEIDGEVPGTITPSLIPAGEAEPCRGRELEHIAFFSDLFDAGGRALDAAQMERIATGLARQNCRLGSQREMTAMYRWFGTGVEAHDCVTAGGASGSLLTCLGPTGGRWVESIVTGTATFTVGQPSTGDYRYYSASVVPSRELKARYRARQAGAGD